MVVFFLTRRVFRLYPDIADYPAKTVQVARRLCRWDLQGEGNRLRETPKEGSVTLSTKGEWIANCLPDRVDRISAASIYLLQVGPPRPNQMQNLKDLHDKGVVGLYRFGKKSREDAANSQRDYLQNSEFAPTLSMLVALYGPGVGTGQQLGGKGQKRADARSGAVPSTSNRAQAQNHRQRPTGNGRKQPAKTGRRLGCLRRLPNL